MAHFVRALLKSECPRLSHLSANLRRERSVCGMLILVNPHSFWGPPIPLKCLPDDLLMDCSSFLAARWHIYWEWSWTGGLVALSVYRSLSFSPYDIFLKSIYNVQKKDKTKTKLAQSFNQMLCLSFCSLQCTTFKGVGVWYYKRLVTCLRWILSRLRKTP